MPGMSCGAVLNQIQGVNLFLITYINSTKLVVSNRGNIPTFIFPSSEDQPGWENVLDVTLTSSSVGELIKNRKVSLENSSSDHRYILFDFMLHIKGAKFFRNPKNTDWEKFKAIVYRRIKPNMGLISIDSAVEKKKKLRKGI